MGRLAARGDVATVGRGTGGGMAYRGAGASGRRAVRPSAAGRGLSASLTRVRPSILSRPPDAPLANCTMCVRVERVLSFMEFYYM